jgi:prephenate dehydrogenase
MYTKILYKNKNKLLAAIEKYNSAIKSLQDLIKEFIRLSPLLLVAEIGGLGAT